MTRVSSSATLRRVLSRALRPVQHALRRRWLMCADASVMMTPRGCSTHRVLLVRLDNIGDFVLWLDAARALVAYYRGLGLQVTLLASASWAEFARELRVFDEVVSLERERFKRNLRYRHSVLRYLRAAGFAKVVQPTMTRVPEMGDAVVRVSGAPERVGVAICGEVAGKQGLYTHLLALDAAALGELRANAAFVRELTGLPYSAKVAELASAIDSDCLQGLRHHLPAAPYVALFPGASEAGKRWPVERFQELALQYREAHGCAVVLCGGPGDAEAAAQVVRACGEGVSSLAGKTSLLQLAAVLAGAQMLVSNDTAAVHLAAAVGTPTVCVVGGGHYGRFLPYQVEVPDARPLPLVAAQAMDCFGCNWRCKYQPAKGQATPCVEGVQVAAVWALAKTVMTPRVEGMEACL